MIATLTNEGTTMAAQTSKTPTKKDTATVKTSTASDAPTGQPVNQPTEPKPAPTRPAPSARSGIRLNVGAVLNAIDTGNASRAVKAIQYALADRGFDPERRDGVFDQATLNAYARYQESIHETGNGEPTAFSLEYLGFDPI